MMPDLSITRIAVSLIEAARRQGLLSLSSIVPPVLLTTNHSTTISSDEGNARALPCAGRGCHGRKQPFIWLLGKNRFIRVAASVASHGRGGGSGKGGVSSDLREARDGQANRMAVFGFAIKSAKTKPTDILK
ncbi:hypothetical protein [Bacteroides heparinolyticus]|uniref:hypothetical protein n=1 Tax=Prevotella heparinolytica TaxID=28113 RepID=UPI00359FD0AE